MAQGFFARLIILFRRKKRPRLQRFTRGANTCQFFQKRSFRAFLRRVGFLKRRLGLGKFALFLKGAAQISMKERLARIECDGLFVSMSPMEGSIARFTATHQSDRVYVRGTASVRRRHDPNTVYPKCKHTYLLKATRWKRRGCPRGGNT